jgi:hypothetical protein
VNPTTSAPGLPPRTWRIATVAGVAVGIVYALSPLTVWFALAIVPLLYWARRATDPAPPVVPGVPALDEDLTWVMWMLLVAVAARLVAVAGLFLLTNHSQVAFGSFFGDEEYFIKRSLWLRNLAFGIPLHGEDLVGAFESYSASSYLYLLALIQILVGPAPYGLHLLGVACYVAAVILLHRLVRSTLGRMPALLGLAVLLFLPSLFAWSVSALKEPLFVLISALCLVLAVHVARGSPSWRRAVALAAVIGLVAVLETIRQGGAVLSGLGILLGLMIAFVAMRPRLMLAALVALPIVLGLTLSRPGVQVKAYTSIQSAARQHWGHVATQGYVYPLLDQRFYDDRSEIADLRFGETMRFLVRAGVGYITVPLPWKVQSRAALAYLPEQIVWYVLVVLAPLGLVTSFRRDAVVTGLLLGHAVVAAVTVAVTSGNIGTMVRHRGLVLPYLVWISAVGACELMTRVAYPRRHEQAMGATFS